MSKTLDRLLYVDVIDDDWDAVLARLASHPHEAAIEVEFSRTPLHRALEFHENDIPITVNVVNAFLGAYKDAVFKVDEDGDTPLHLACEYGMSMEIVKILLEANPDATSVRNYSHTIPLHNCRVPEIIDLLLATYPEGVGIVDREGGSPLHYAANDAEEGSLSILRSLLKAGTKVNFGGVDGGGGVLVEDNVGRTPLKLACDMLLEDQYQDSINLLWEKVYVMARAAFASLAKRNADINEDGPLLHALVASQCPQFVILRTLSANPNQTSERDSLGRTPLAIAASQHVLDPEMINLLLGDDHFDSRIAGMATKEKRLPLHLAAESGWEFEYLEKIRQAAPAALETRDVPTRMYPFMLAAEGDHSNLNSVYQLLRASPKMARGMAEGIHWENSKLRLQCENREQRELLAEQATMIVDQAEENTMLRDENAKLWEEIAKLRERNNKLEPPAKKRKLEDE